MELQRWATWPAHRLPSHWLGIQTELTRKVWSSCVETCGPPDHWHDYLCSSCLFWLPVFTHFMCFKLLHVTSESQGDIACDSLGDVTWVPWLHRDLSPVSDGSRMRKPQYEVKNAKSLFDWCCFYCFVRNSLVALLEASCARIFSSDSWISVFSDIFFCVCKVSNKAFLPPLSTRLLCLVVAIPLVCWLYMCACVCASVCACENV